MVPAVGDAAKVIAWGDGPGFKPGGIANPELAESGFPNSSLPFWLGDAPTTPPGEAQFVTVTGDVAGDSSLFMEDFARPGGAMASEGTCDFFI